MKFPGKFTPDNERILSRRSAQIILTNVIIEVLGQRNLK